jgi:hypothetical protein
MGTQSVLKSLTVQAVATADLGGLSVFAGQGVGDAAPAGQ